MWTFNYLANPKMLRNVFINLIAILFLFVTGVFSQVEKGVFPRKDIKIYLGIWMPALSHPGMHSTEDREYLKRIGANTAAFAIQIPYLENGELHQRSLEVAKTKARSLIRYYKEGGLAIFFSPDPVLARYFGEPAPIPSEVREIFLKNYESAIIELAKIAEEEQVEIFSPMNEPDYKLGIRRSSTWGQEILPKIKKVYSGKILWNGSLARAFDSGKRIDFSGYDIAGFTVFPWRGLGNYNQLIDFYLETIRRQAKEDDVDKVFISEFGVYFRAKAEDEPRALEMVFECGEGKVDGFFVLDPPQGFGTPIKESHLEAVIKKWFNRLK
jgi:hypothetical protein